MTCERAVESRVERGSMEEGGAMGGKGGVTVVKWGASAAEGPEGAAVNPG